MSIVFKKCTSFDRNYLFSCDILNKYFCKNIHKMPVVKKIIFSFTLNDFSKNKHTNGESNELKGFLFLYLLCAVRSFLRVKLISLNKTLGKSESGSFSFKVIFNKKFVIHELFQFILLENFELIDKNNHQSNNYDFPTKNIGSSFSYNFNLMGDALFDIQNSFFFTEKNVNKNGFKLRLRIFLNKSSKITPTKNLLLNTDPFWINGRVV